MKMVKITILSKEKCAFCDQAKALFQRLAGEYPLSSYGRSSEKNLRREIER